jgi:hypothetical protein
MSKAKSHSVSVRHLQIWPYLLSGLFDPVFCDEQYLSVSVASTDCKRMNRAMTAKRLCERAFIGERMMRYFFVRLGLELAKGDGGRESAPPSQGSWVVLIVRRCICRWGYASCGVQLTRVNAKLALVLHHVQRGESRTKVVCHRSNQCPAYSL